MGVLAIWFLLTAVILVAGMIWAFAPVLVPFIAVAAGFGGVAGLMIGLARGLERYLSRRRHRR